MIFFWRFPLFGFNWGENVTGKNCWSELILVREKYWSPIKNWSLFTFFFSTDRVCEIGKSISYSFLWLLFTMYFIIRLFCRTIWSLVEYNKLLFPEAILCCILTNHYYINNDFHQVLVVKFSIVEYNSGYCKRHCWLYRQLLSLKYFLWDITYKVLAVLHCTARFSVRVCSNTILQLLLTNSCILGYQLLLLCEVFFTLTVSP